MRCCRVSADQVDWEISGRKLIKVSCTAAKKGITESNIWVFFSRMAWLLYLKPSKAEHMTEECSENLELLEFFGKHQRTKTSYFSAILRLQSILTSNVCSKTCTREMAELSTRSCRGSEFISKTSSEIQKAGLHSSPIPKGSGWAAGTSKSVCSCYNFYEHSLDILWQPIYARSWLSYSDVSRRAFQACRMNSPPRSLQPRSPPPRTCE
jgi:hypothetical protein